MKDFNPPPVKDPYLEASKMVTSYTLKPDEIFEMHEIQKKLHVLYANSAKRYAVIWFGEAGGQKEGCSPLDEPVSADQLKPL